MRLILGLVAGLAVGAEIKLDTFSCASKLCSSSYNQCNKHLQHTSNKVAVCQENETTRATCKCPEGYKNIHRINYVTCEYRPYLDKNSAEYKPAVADSLAEQALAYNETKLLADGWTKRTSNISKQLFYKIAQLQNDETHTFYDAALACKKIHQDATLLQFLSTNEFYFFKGALSNEKSRIDSAENLLNFNKQTGNKKSRFYVAGYWPGDSVSVEDKDRLSWQWIYDGGEIPVYQTVGVSKDKDISKSSFCLKAIREIIVNNDNSEKIKVSLEKQTRLLN